MDTATAVSIVTSWRAAFSSAHGRQPAKADAAAVCNCICASDRLARLASNADIHADLYDENDAGAVCRFSARVRDALQTAADAAKARARAAEAAAPSATAVDNVTAVASPAEASTSQRGSVVTIGRGINSNLSSSARAPSHSRATPASSNSTPLLPSMRAAMLQHAMAAAQAPVVLPKPTSTAPAPPPVAPVVRFAPPSAASSTVSYVRARTAASAAPAQSYALTQSQTSSRPTAPLNDHPATSTVTTTATAPAHRPRAAARVEENFVTLNLRGKSSASSRARARRSAKLRSVAVRARTSNGSQQWDEGEGEQDMIILSGSGSEDEVDEPEPAPPPIAPTATSSGSKGYPLCTHGEETVRRVVKRATRNVGRRFFVCARNHEQCRFFLWADSHVMPAQAAYLTSYVDMLSEALDPQPLGFDPAAVKGHVWATMRATAHKSYTVARLKLDVTLSGVLEDQVMAKRVVALAAVMAPKRAPRVRKKAKMAAAGGAAGAKQKKAATVKVKKPVAAKLVPVPVVEEEASSGSSSSSESSSSSSSSSSDSSSELSSGSSSDSASSNSSSSDSEGSSTTSSSSSRSSSSSSASSAASSVVSDVFVSRKRTRKQRAAAAPPVPRVKAVRAKGGVTVAKLRRHESVALLAHARVMVMLRKVEAAAVAAAATKARCAQEIADYEYVPDDMMDMVAQPLATAADKAVDAGAAATPAETTPDTELKLKP